MKLRRLCCLLLALCLIGGAVSASGSIATPTDLTDPPEEAPTAVPTDAPTGAPTQAPPPVTAAPDDPADPGWDESLCDHMNPNCLQAPPCSREGCAHIAQDANGLDIPLCAKGRWVLDRQDEAARLAADGRLRVIAKSVRSQVIDLTKADAAIYRSGVYHIKGGLPEDPEEEEPLHRTITVAEDRLVILETEEVTSGGLFLCARVSAALRLQGVSAFEALSLSRESRLQITEGGHARFDTVTFDPEESEILITGGSVDAQLQEGDRRERRTFSAPEASAVRLNGDDYPANCPDAQGVWHLWLDPAPDGAHYEARTAEGVLHIDLTSDDPQLTVAPTATPEPTATPTLPPEETPVPRTVLTVLGEEDEPVADTLLVLHTGETTWKQATDGDGKLFLTDGIADNTAVAAMGPEQVYTGIVMDGEAVLDLTSLIADVAAADLETGETEITFTAENAASFGVQWIEGEELADDYVKDAARVAGDGERILVPEVPAGADVTLRVYVARAEGAELTERSADGFRFSEEIRHHHRGVFVPAEIPETPYTGKPWVCPVELPEGVQITYKGKKLEEDGKPVRVGSYKLVLTIPEDHPDYFPGTFVMPFRIAALPLTIMPEPNQEKYMGDEDPEEFLYTAEGLLEGDRITGRLTRNPGEEPGNYAFRIDSLRAPEHYRMKLQRKAPKFTILPLPDDEGWFPSGFWERLYPVEQEIVRADGRVLRVVMNLQDSLVLTHSRFGSIVRSTEKYEPAAFFLPSLSWDRDSDEVLLRLRTVPHMNEDKGYATDEEGHPVWDGRMVRMLWSNLNYMHSMGVDTLSLCNGQMAVTCRLEDLLSEAVLDLIKQEKGAPGSTSIRMKVIPEEEAPDSAMTGLWRVAITLSTRQGQETDISALCPSASVAADLEPVAVFLRDVGMYDENAFPEQFVLRSGDTGEAGAEFVEPYMPGEKYRGLLYTHRYLLAPLKGEDLLCVAAREVAP